MVRVKIWMGLSWLWLSLLGSASPRSPSTFERGPPGVSCVDGDERGPNRDDRCEGAGACNESTLEPGREGEGGKIVDKGGCGVGGGGERRDETG